MTFPTRLFRRLVHSTCDSRAIILQSKLEAANLKIDGLVLDTVTLEKEKSRLQDDSDRLAAALASPARKKKAGSGASKKT